MEFDRKGPEGGFEIYTSIENGKALLECKVYLRKAVAEELLEEATGISMKQTQGAYLDIRMWDREDRLVFCCCHPLWQKELAKGLVMHPRLWQGTEDPYLYRVQVSLMEKGKYPVDVIEDVFAFRTLREIPRKGWFLNGRPFPVRAVAYVIPTSVFVGSILDKDTRSTHIRRDLEIIRRMGANTVCPVGGKIDREFCRICDEMGLLMWWRDHEEESRRLKEKPISECNAANMPDVPQLYGTADSLLTIHGRFPTERYYYYKARWCKEPFVYISTESLILQENGNARVTVYSNQEKVALYVDGILFDFRSEGPVFLFEEIPVKKLPLMLAAEAGEYCMSVTAYPFTEFSQKNHFSMTFNAYNDLSEDEQA